MADHVGRVAEHPQRRAVAAVPGRVTTRGCREQRREAREVPDVVPPEGGGHDDDATGIRRGLGHGVVDGDPGQAGPDLREQRRVRGDGPQPRASSGCHCASRSSSVAARTTNMPAFQRNSPDST